MTTKDVAKYGTLLHRALHSGSMTERERAKTSLREALSTSDLPIALGPTMNKIMLKEYEDAPITWTEWASRTTTRDFKTVPFFNFDFDESNIPAKSDGKSFVTQGLPGVGELDEYPALNLNVSLRQLDIRKSGVQIPISWETLLTYGSDWGIIPRVLREFARRARNEEEIQAAGQLVTTAGINTANFNVQNKNVLTGNPELTYDSLKSALDQLARTEVNGRRIATPSSYNLIVGPALAATAAEILAVKEIRTTSGRRTEITGNAVVGSINKVHKVNAFSYIAGAAADKAWFLVPALGTMPNDCITNVFFEGLQQPQVFVEKTTTSDPLEGSFINDSYRTKVRAVVKGAAVDLTATMASSGAGA